MNAVSRHDCGREKRIRKRDGLSNPGEAKQVGEAVESREGLESGPC